MPDAAVSVASSTSEVMSLTLTASAIQTVTSSTPGLTTPDGVTSTLSCRGTGSTSSGTSLIRERHAEQ
eukprot:606107-Heterocapsa_arctica.AAC.1